MLLRKIVISVIALAVGSIANIYLNISSLNSDIKRQAYYTEISPEEVENNLDEEKSNKIVAALKTFAKIFLNNFIVGILLSIVGFLTGGVLSVVYLIFNGFFITNSIMLALITGNPTAEIISLLIYHAPFEIVALIWLSVIGLGGFSFYRKILKSDYIDKLQIKTSLRQLLYPNLLLLFAAIVETLSGYFQNMI